jgi:hypothetical protein
MQSPPSAFAYRRVDARTILVRRVPDALLEILGDDLEVASPGKRHHHRCRRSEGDADRSVVAVNRRQTIRAGNALPVYRVSSSY